MNVLNQVINGILTVYVSVQRNTKPEVDCADRACEVSTLTEGFVFTYNKFLDKPFSAGKFAEKAV